MLTSRWIGDAPNRPAERISYLLLSPNLSVGLGPVELPLQDGFSRTTRLLERGWPASSASRMACQASAFPKEKERPDQITFLSRSLMKKGPSMELKTS